MADALFFQYCTNVAVAPGNDAKWRGNGFEQYSRSCWSIEIFHFITASTATLTTTTTTTTNATTAANATTIVIITANTVAVAVIVVVAAITWSDVLLHKTIWIKPIMIK